MSNEPDLPSAEDIATTRGEGPQFRRPVPFASHGLGDGSEYSVPEDDDREIPRGKPYPPMDEMAAGLIHEPGTSGIEYPPITEAARESDRRERIAFGPLYAISGYALDEIRQALLNLGANPSTLNKPGAAIRIDSRASRALGFITAARDNGPLPEPPAAADVEEPPAIALARLQQQLTIAEQQRDLLSRQVDSLVQRLAGSHVAAGSFDMAAAQGFVQKEILPINQVLAQIAAQPQGE